MPFIAVFSETLRHGRLLWGLGLLMIGLLACSPIADSDKDHALSGETMAPQKTVSAKGETEKNDAPAAGADKSQSQDAAFNILLDDHWAWTLAQAPTFATSLGVRDYDDRLGDPSLAALDAAVKQEKQFLDRLEAINPQALSKDNQLNWQLLHLELQNDIEANEYGGRYMLITNRGGPHLAMAGLPDRLPFFTRADYQSYVTRLSSVPTYMERATERLRVGVQAGWVQPCAPMEDYEDTIRVHIVDSPAKSKFMQPFAKRPSTISEEDFEALRQQALQKVRAGIVPAYKKFLQFYENEYRPNCREQVGTSSMPGGRAYYDYRVRLFTTTNLSADQVHELGLKEVARIRKEMQATIKEAGFQGSFDEWLDYLRTNPDLYPKTAEQRMQVAARIAKKMDGELPNLFTRFPRVPYGLKEIPLDIAEKTTTAYYQPPAGDGSRAGFYYINTTKLDTRPLHELEALTLHEAVPGHHFQIALAQELDLPNFRRYGGVTAFVEGWGLYSERLGLEVGFYDNPYTDFGRLSYEMWRACRLVVDTGIHAKGWSRQQAIDYMAANTGLSMNNITTEVDRYITWPGQALAYKMGELKIRELRAYAEQSLGEDFDIRQFHDRILENGALPLSVLEEKIHAWVDEEKVKAKEKAQQPIQTADQ